MAHTFSDDRISPLPERPVGITSTWHRNDSRSLEPEDKWQWRCLPAMADAPPRGSILTPEVNDTVNFVVNNVVDFVVNSFPSLCRRHPSFSNESR